MTRRSLRSGSRTRNHESWCVGVVLGQNLERLFALHDHAPAGLADPIAH